ncbi:Retrovirus-related Pol polyprotein from transposon 17.6 [Labeo rohita]|uniref:Gypsy retrotransposon integrase-like protein 1 n=1 Tax=Labeo rohita TaxID=84645 RepID=A0ABQ8L2J4_LABRO|nr:Retrovirus-related Pol polyprotein from transposon 17.6 [Labeo rohita]
MYSKLLWRRGVVLRNLQLERRLGDERTRVSLRRAALFLPFCEHFYTGAETREGSGNAAAVMSTPSSSPFAEVIHSLAGLHQEHHQALLDMREDQERRFQALVQTQQEDRELFRSWMDREVRAGGVTSAPALPAHMPLNKMGPQDDPEAFIDLFERTAEACGWPQTNWPVRLIPLLSGEAQMAAQQLPVQNLLVYDDLKRAILQRVGLNPEQQRQRFRSLELGENGRPFVMAQQLRDACRRWLLAGGSDVDQIIDRVVLEQFIARLPKKTAQWVQCHRPTSLDLAIQLAEDQMVACHGVGETLPSVSLSLLPSSTSKPVPFPRSRVNLPDRPQPRWRGCPAPESAGLRPLSRGTGPTSSSATSVPVPLLSPRQSLDLLPTTRAAGKSGPACWRCGDPGHFIDRCPVMEVGTLVRVPDAPQAAPDQAGLYQIPVSIKGGTYWALVDSGCNQTSIHQSLIQPEALDKSRVVQVLCVHGDVAGEVEPRLPEAEPGEPNAVERLNLTERDDFPLEKSQDETLKNAFEQVCSIDGQPLQSARPPSYPYFAILKDRLYRVTQDTQTKQDTTQLLVPKSRREALFQAAHCNPMAGHLGQAATLNRLMARFFWPGIHENVRRWCATCRECQLVNPPASPKAPLRPLPLIQVPFERIGMDLIGPLERSARGHRFALVLVDYATRYPEAVALRNISAKSVAEALFRIISRVGIPKEILTDQGTTFMSRTVRELYELLGIKSIRTSVYHPQTDGLVERFNRTLKTMIRKFVHEDAKNWDKWLEPLLFAVREVPQASTGFSPFELLYGRQPCGVLGVLREAWEEGPSDSKNEIQYVLDLRTKLHTLGQLSMENLLQAQDRQSRLYNRGTRLRNFAPGDKVTRRMGDLNYEVVRTNMSGARQIYHLNLLKKWSEVEPVMLATAVSGEEDLGPEVRPQISKTAAVATCPRPKTKKEVRQFLGLAGYYRRFVPNYSDLTSPLTDLTKKEAPDPVQWTELCQQAFTQTDASDRGLGAVLSQETDGEEQLNISRKLSKRETMYSTIEKECLAIRWAVLTLRYYLLGREFTLCSDNAPLQWLHRMKDTNAWITRWYLALQPFKFKVIHRPGAQMAVADFLSRKGGGGRGLQAGGIPSLSQAVGVCGDGGVVLWNLQLERRLGDEREELEEAQRDCLVILELWIGGTRTRYQAPYRLNSSPPPACPFGPHHSRASYFSVSLLAPPFHFRLYVLRDCVHSRGGREVRRYLHRRSKIPYHSVYTVLCHGAKVRRPTGKMPGMPDYQSSTAHLV